MIWAQVATEDHCTNLHAIKLADRAKGDDSGSIIIPVCDGPNGPGSCESAEPCRAA